MKVKIIKADSDEWYFYSIGNILEVEDYSDGDCYSVKDMNGYYILKEDCEIIEDSDKNTRELLINVYSSGEVDIEGDDNMNRMKEVAQLIAKANGIELKWDDDKGKSEEFNITPDGDHINIYSPYKITRYGIIDKNNDARSEVLNNILTGHYKIQKIYKKVSFVEAFKANNGTNDKHKRVKSLFDYEIFVIGQIQHASVEQIDGEWEIIE